VFNTEIRARSDTLREGVSANAHSGQGRQLTINLATLALGFDFLTQALFSRGTRGRHSGVATRRRLHPLYLCLLVESAAQIVKAHGQIATAP